jgi:hypothetical protein
LGGGDALGLGYVPFEAPASVEPSVPKRFVETVRLVLFSPSQFYPRLLPSAEVTRPLIFGYGCMLAGMLLSLAWLLVIDLPKSELIENAVANTEGIASFHEFVLVLMVLAPIFAAVQMAVEVAVFHAFAKLVGGSATVKKSFQLYAYSSAAHLLKALPGIGGIMYWMARVFTQLTGVRIIHRVSTARAALVVLVPLMAGFFLQLGVM